MTDVENPYADRRGAIRVPYDELTLPRFGRVEAVEVHPATRTLTIYLYDDGVDRGELPVLPLVAAQAEAPITVTWKEARRG